MIDLLVKNGVFLDSFAGRAGKYTIGIKNDRIFGVYPEGVLLPESKEVLDIDGNYITSGWIDLHTHVYPEKTSLGIDADTVGINQGVTTILDAGSSGYKTFPDFEENVIRKSNTRVLTWLNIAGKGLCGGRSELADQDDIDIKKTVDLIQSTPCIRGIKVRMSSSVLGKSGLMPLKKAREVSKMVGRPLLVHVGNGPPSLGDIFNVLEKGDVVTHAFHGKSGGSFNESGEPLSEMLEALKRGVYLDIGHGTSSFAFLRMEQAIEKGIWPDSISTDIYCSNYQGPVFSLACTVEKCLALGMPLATAIASVTARPAVMIGMPELGTVRAGSHADLTIFYLTNEQKKFMDAEGNIREGKTGIRMRGAIKSGKVWLKNV